MKTILVTGGTGFLGSNLCRRLVDDGHKVICMDNNYTGRTTNIGALVGRPNFRFIRHDICEPFGMDEHLDQIYNLACPASPPAYQGKHSIATTKTCVFGAVNMLELAKIFGDHMVLQRGVPLPVWGRADAGARVERKKRGARKRRALQGRSQPCWNKPRRR